MKRNLPALLLLAACLLALPSVLHADDSLNVSTLDRLLLDQHMNAADVMLIHDDRAWFGSGDDGIRGVEIDPEYGLGRVAHGIWPGHDIQVMKAFGNRLYVLGSHDLTIIDTDTPVSVLGSVHLGSQNTACNIDVWGNSFAIVHTGATNLLMIDTRYVEAPYILDTIDIGGLREPYMSEGITSVLATNHHAVAGVFYYEIHHATIVGYGSRMYKIPLDFYEGFTGGPSLVFSGNDVENHFGDILKYRDIREDTLVVFTQQFTDLQGDFAPAMLHGFYDLGNGPVYPHSIQPGIRAYKGEDYLLQLTWQNQVRLLAGLDILTGDQIWTVNSPNLQDAGQTGNVVIADVHGIGGDGRLVHQWNIANSDTIRPLPAWDPEINGPAAYFDGEYLVSLYEGLAVFEASENEITSRVYQDSFTGARDILPHQWVWYVPCGEGGLRVYNAMDRTHPELTSHFGELDIRSVAVAEDRLIGIGSDGWIEFDLQYLGVPLLEMQDPDRTGDALLVHDNYLYAFDNASRTLSTYELPAVNLVHETVVGGSGAVERLERCGDAIVLPTNQGVTHVDVSNPEEPLVTQNWIASQGVQNLHVLWDRFVTTTSEFPRWNPNTWCFKVWDTGMGTPQEIARFETQDLRLAGAWTYGERAFALRQDGLVLFDLSTVLDVPEEEKDPSPLPEVFALESAWPNPFNQSLKMRLALPSAGNVDLVAYNVLGQAVDRMTVGRLEAGMHVQQWMPREWASGVYFLQARTPDGTWTAPLKVVYVR